MIEYQVDEQMLEEVRAKLGEMSRKAPTVISRALNKVAVTARVDLANKAQATYTVNDPESVRRKTGSGDPFTRQAALNH